MKRRGFTIMELVVTMVVSAILISAVFSVFFTIKTYSDKQQREIPIENELEDTEKEIRRFFSMYDANTFLKMQVVSLPAGDILYLNGEADKIEITNAKEEEPLKVLYGNSSFGQAELQYRYCTHIQKINFEMGESPNTVSVIFTYKTAEEAEAHYRFLLIKNSLNKDS